MEDIDDLPIATQTCRSQVTPAAPSTIGVSSSTSVRVSTCSSSISESTSSNKVAESSISPSSSSSTVQNTPNTVYVTYTHTAVVMSTVQMTMSVVDKQLVTSSDSSDCNTAAIVVPIVVSVITVVVVIVSIVVAAVWWRRSKPEPVIISVKNSHTCVVENDLYKLAYVYMCSLNNIIAINCKVCCSYSFCKFLPYALDFLLALNLFCYSLKLNYRKFVP